jgi:hypothetical protein
MLVAEPARSGVVVIAALIMGFVLANGAWARYKRGEITRTAAVFEWAIAYAVGLAAVVAISDWGYRGNAYIFALPVNPFALASVGLLTAFARVLHWGKLRTRPTRRRSVMLAAFITTPVFAAALSLAQLPGLAGYVIVVGTAIMLISEIGARTTQES